MNAKPYPFIEAFKRRGLGILQDDVDPQQRAVLVAACERIDYDLLNQVFTISGGVPLVALSPMRAEAFLFARMTRPGAGIGGAVGTAYQMYISVDAREGITTGISISDRLRTLNILGEAQPQPRKLVRPGHIFPVETREGGVLVRNALPEGALDLARISGFSDAALLVDLLDQNGGYLTPSSQSRLAQVQALPTTTLSELTAYRLQTEPLVVRVAEASLPTAATGLLRSYIYRSKLYGGEHLALVKGEISPVQPVLTRVQMEFTAADVFGGVFPPTRSQIHACLRAIGDGPTGVFLYLRRSVKGHLKEQVHALSLGKPPQRPLNLREYGIGAQILYDLGARRIELLTNTPSDLASLKSFGLEVVSQRQLPREKEYRAYG
ncbi:MAG: hypothetical protein GX589_04125 [Deltaproteobacteria bacterium]|nr:hypothetical protein [Deltaproteobacteria bacterium]